MVESEDAETIKLQDQLIEWKERLDERERETATQQMMSARDRALGEILAMEAEELMEKFNQTAKEDYQTKALEEMTDKEKLEVMISMFNDIATAS